MTKRGRLYITESVKADKRWGEVAYRETGRSDRYGKHSIAFKIAKTNRSQFGQGKGEAIVAVGTLDEANKLNVFCHLGKPSV